MQCLLSKKMEKYQFQSTDCVEICHKEFQRIYLHGWVKVALLLSRIFYITFIINFVLFLLISHKAELRAINKL